ncbi:DNA binding domain, excisionase family [Paenibacillus polymyxa]|uniref:helix-turn-helix domain-containing protein n=1 Tax=Paenibacillus polymyxa TaxID=1406 RepID=UPI000D867ECA|nr:helix-turn-helix domain-containing protein [Paenibacillus polymyxa]SPY16944.1 DNA binding domain, excisionase family [Paenibacillus polymyxa]
MDNKDLLDEISKRVLAKIQPDIIDFLSNQMNISQDRKLDVAQASEYLGIADKTLYTMCKKKIIPHRRYGTRIMFSSAALDAWGREQDRLNYQPNREGVSL